MAVTEIRLLSLAVIFLAWWVVSAGNQIRSGRLVARVRWYIPFGLIPSWTFFAPNPARADSRLVWREEVDARWGDWKELHFGFTGLGRRWFFNPELVQNKAIADLTGAVMQLDREIGPRSFLLSSSYVTLLTVVLGQSRSPEATAVQFAIVRTSVAADTRSVVVAFVSEAHDTRDAAVDVC